MRRRWGNTFNAVRRPQRSSSNRDLWISHIRLSDKTSRLHPRHVVPKPAQAYLKRDVPTSPRQTGSNSEKDAGLLRARSPESNGFIYTVSTNNFAPFDYPGALSTQLTGVNDFGQLVGFYFDGVGSHGFFQQATRPYGPGKGVSCRAARTKKDGVYIRGREGCSKSAGPS